MVTKEEIKNSFKNTEIHKVIDTICEDVENFEYSKGDVSGFSINVWRIAPMEDEGSFLYYDREEDRDSDFDLLCGIVESREL
jgi:hypothetical protein